MLAGLRVLDLSTWLPGPYCTFLLAEMGAEVIKVEQPGVGDKQRVWDPWLFKNLNGNKKSITINLKNPNGVKIFKELARKSNVVLESFRPGVVERLGIDSQSIAMVNECIIYCSISGYGQEGPHRLAPGHDINYLGLVGGLSMGGDPQEAPRDGSVQGMPIGDLASGALASSTILSSYIGVLKSGKGQYIDLSITDILFSWVAYKSGSFFTEGILPTTSTKGEAHYGVFRTGDGRYVTLGVYEDDFWVKMCQMFDWQDFLKDDRFKTYHQRNKLRNEILPRLRKRLIEMQAEDLLAEAKKFGIPCEPVLSVSEAVDHPQIQFRKMVNQEIDSGGISISKINVPFKLKEDDVKHSPAPELGEHTDGLLSELGVSADGIASLRKEGVV